MVWTGIRVEFMDNDWLVWVSNQSRNITACLTVKSRIIIVTFYWLIIPLAPTYLDPTKRDFLLHLLYYALAPDIECVVNTSK
jgi:hypothetical protein